MKTPNPVEDQLRESTADLESLVAVLNSNLQPPLLKILSDATAFKNLYHTEPAFSQYLARVNDEVKGRVLAKQTLLKEVIHSSERMIAVIDGFVKYTRAGKRVGAIIAIDEILTDVVADFQPMIETSSMKLEIGPMPILEVDPMQIKHLFQNLIMNSIKYRNGKPPHICITACESDTEWTFCVSDNGCGISLKDQKRIFDLFVRLEDRSDDSNSGTGLAISRRIVERHGGEIWVESRSYKGAKFFFTLPKQGQQ